MNLVCNDGEVSIRQPEAIYCKKSTRLLENGKLQHQKNKVESLSKSSDGSGSGSKLIPQSNISAGFRRGILNQNQPLNQDLAIVSNRQNGGDESQDLASHVNPIQLEAKLVPLKMQKDSEQINMMQSYSPTKMSKRYENGSAFKAERIVLEDK